MRKTLGKINWRLSMHWYCMPWEDMSSYLGYSMIFDFVCGVIAIIGFVIGLIAYKTACKYEKNTVTTIAKIAKLLSLAGIIFNLLLGIIFVINRIIHS